MTLRSRASTLVAGSFVVAITVVALAPPATVSGAAPIPDRVFAPYFETWTSGRITLVARGSGARYLTLAFLQTLGPSSCQLAWNGESSRRVGSGAYLNDIHRLRRLGGDVIPSLGGWSADQAGTEIGDSCGSVGKIAAAYKSLIRTYDVSRLDMDIEGASLGRSAGIDRRNKAIKLVQDWAAAHSRPLTISYTLPISRDGLGPDALAVLQNAVANGVRIDVVQPMVFDYFDGRALDMGDSAINALKGLHSQLASLLPALTSAEVWARQGAILMIGRDDVADGTETTTLADARQVKRFARSKGMAALSFWAIQRDNGGCPGVSAAGNCSGIAQRKWAFTRVLAGFTR